MTSDTDFTGKTVLVVGGSSGIGNGIAHGFAQRGAKVHVWGTKPAAADYDPADGSDLTGLGYTCVDVGDADGRRLLLSFGTGTNEGWITAARYLKVSLAQDNERD